jgi:hypothetical protein
LSRRQHGLHANTRTITEQCRSNRFTTGNAGSERAKLRVLNPGASHVGWTRHSRGHGQSSDCRPGSEHGLRTRRFYTRGGWQDFQIQTEDMRTAPTHAPQFESHGHRGQFRNSLRPGFHPSGQWMCWAAVCLAALCWIACRQENREKDQMTKPAILPKTAVGRHVAAVQNVLRARHVNYESREWASPMSSDEKVWLWGSCSAEDFEYLVTQLNLDANTNILARWPNASDGPPKVDGWRLRQLPNSQTYLKEVPGTGVMTFATRLDGTFYLKIVSN